MINLKFRLLYVSFFVLLLMGCVAETGIPDTSKGEEGAAVTLRLDTRALGTGESQINTLRVIQVKRNIAKSIANNQFIANPGTPLLIPGVSGAYDIYIIANEMDDDSELAALKNAADLEELRQVILPYDVAQRTTTTIPMFGKVEEVTIGLPTTIGGHATIKVGGVDKGTTIATTVTRLAVRIDLTVKSKSFSGLASVSFTGLPDGISLFGNNYEPASGSKQTLTVQGSAFTTITPVTAGYITEKKRESIILPSYLFDPKTEVSKAARIEVFIQGKPASFGAAIGHVAQPAALNKDYTLHPNAQYTLAALVAGDDLTIESQVKNWEMAPSDYPAGGGSFWNGQPIDTRVGLNGTEAEATATFTTTLTPNGTSVSFKWYRIKQTSNDDFTLVTEEMNAGIATSGNTSNLTLTATGLNDACMVYCVATITAQDGKTDRLESNQATFMPVGDWVQPLGTYPAMQDWKYPQNAPLGSTCLLQDTRDNKVYRVKLMADGNWWMIQDLAYGNASSEDDFIGYVKGHIKPALMNIIAAQTYGLAMAEGSSTGGLFYNCHAASQVYELLPNDNKYDFHSSNMKYTLLPSFCPDGWHLPGNLNDTANWEWINLVDKTKMISARKFSYNSPSDLNAYSEDLFDNSCYFHGGYFAAKASGREPVAYLNLGLQDSGSEILVGEALAERFTNDVKASIRCIRNFK